MIFENTTRWNTEDLRAYLERALALINADGMPPMIDCGTVILAKHSSMNTDLVRGSTAGRHTTNTVVLRLVTPERAGVDVITALGSVATGEGAMPLKMRRELWEACFNVLRSRAWSFGKTLKIPKDLPGVRIMVKRGMAPNALSRQLDDAKLVRDRAADELAKCDAKVDKLTKKLTKERA